MSRERTKARVAFTGEALALAALADAVEARARVRAGVIRCAIGRKGRARLAKEQAIHRIHSVMKSTESQRSIQLKNPLCTYGCRPPRRRQPRSGR